MSDPWSDNPIDLDGSRVINRRIYVDPDIFAAECDSIFAATWQWVAHETEMLAAGDYVTCTIAGRNIVVARDKAGRLNAFYNTCTHRGACLTERHKGNCGGKFVCMYHGWSFDTAGKLIGVSWADAYGEKFDRRLYDIPAIRLDTWGGNIFVALDGVTTSLVEYLGEAAEHIERLTGRHEALGRVRWLIDGNWKLWHENFRDNYHPQFTHGLVGAGYRGVDASGVNMALEPAHSLLEFPPQRDTEQVDRMFREIGYQVECSQTANRRPPYDVDTSSHLEILAVFPNLDIQSFLEGAGGCFLQVVRPIAIDKTMVELVSFGVAGETAEARSWRLKRDIDLQTAAGKISGDDIEAARRCTTGFSAFREVAWSTIDRGQEAGKAGGKHDEYSLRKFYASYKQYMADALYT